MIKRVVLVLGVLLLLVLAGVFWLRGNLDRLVKEAVERYGSEMVQASVQVGKVSIDALNGHGELHDLVIGNPVGFKTAHAVKVADIRFDVDVASLTQPVVLVRRIEIKAPDVIYEKGETLTNFEAIQKNIAAYLGTPGQAESASGSQEEKPVKMIVDEFSLRMATAHASAGFMSGKTVGVDLPDVVLRDVGRAQGGVTPAEFGQIVAAALQKKLSLSYNFDRALKATGEALNNAGKTIKGWFQ